MYITWQCIFSLYQTNIKYFPIFLVFSKELDRIMMSSSQIAFKNIMFFFYLNLYRNISLLKNRQKKVQVSLGYAATAACIRIIIIDQSYRRRINMYNPHTQNSLI